MSTAIRSGTRVVGARADRHEDDRLLRGRGQFADDVDRIGQAYVRVVRAEVAHARIVSVDTSTARAVPGVLAVVTGEDLAEIGPIPIRLPRGDEPDGCLQPVMARAEVSYVGEPVAAVVAEEPYVAEDAAELVEVTYRDLPVATEAEDVESAVTLHVGYGEVEDAFAAAARVVEVDVQVGRHGAVPLEPRALVAEYDRDSASLRVWGGTKVPVFNRDVLARMLGMDADRVRLHAMDAGGGFGARGEFYPEDLLVPWLARRLCRPVKWTEDRAESLVALNHSRQQRHRIALAFDEQARILALRDDIAHDNGAYLRTHGLLVPELTAGMLPGPYRVPAYDARVHVALTNKTPCGTYRAPGRYEGTFAREHLIDVAADRLGLDQVELRRRNLLTQREIPHVRPLRALGTDMVLDAGNYPALLDTAMDKTRSWQPEKARLRALGHRAGIGFGVFLEKSGLGPHETADVIVRPDGTVRVHSGGTSLGQGIETVLAQIAAERLGVQHSVVDVVNGDTQLQPFGLGSWASRSTVVAGSAVDRAASAVVERARTVAARMFGVAEMLLETGAGGFSVAGEPGRFLDYGAIAAACVPGGTHLQADEEPGLWARRVFQVEHMTYPYGVHVALVDVDTGTGQLSILRYLVAYEVGKAINPTLVEGQLVGGVAQGVGGAVSENFTYDERGEPQAASFMDYLMPTASETPDRVESVITEEAPSPGNPLGAKGAGEGGVTAVGAALANAARDALDLTGDVGELPMTAERICQLAETATETARENGC